MSRPNLKSKLSVKTPLLKCRRQRAIFQDDKQSRELDLIAGAAKLFSKREFSEIGIVDICKEAGLAKGTFYLYFDSKEEIFLRVTQELFVTWGDKILVVLRQLPFGVTTVEFARAYTRSLNDFDLLLRLLTILHSVIEKNVAVDAIRPFKRTLAGIQFSQIAEFRRIFPTLSETSLLDLAMFLTSNIIGTWSLAHPPLSALQALEAEGLRGQIPVFEDVFFTQVNTYLLGLMLRPDNKAAPSDNF